MKAKRIFGISLIATGLLLLAAALWIVLGNVMEDSQAAKASQEALNAIRNAPRPTAPAAETPATDPAANLPEYIRNPDMPMPTMETDGREYIGVLDIPALELSLPVLSEWSYPLLQKAPCRFQGTVYKKDMIIMAHNYWRHFGTLSRLRPDDEVYFTDIQGNVFSYLVTENERVDGDDITGMLNGDWDLTLFTCNTSGEARVTIRCVCTNLP